jgi:hypothetical protein
MPEEGKHEDRRRHGGHFLIPAGALIGLGFVARGLARRG